MSEIKRNDKKKTNATTIEAEKKREKRLIIRIVIYKMI